MCVTGWETLNWEMISSIVTATATVVLAIFTIRYVSLLKQQADSRNRWELCVYVYDPLVSRLKRIIEIPDRVDANYKGYGLNSMSCKNIDSRLFLMLEKTYSERLISFEDRYDRYRQFMEYTKEKIGEILIQRIHDQFKISVKHVYGIDLRIHPSMILARKIRNIYSFILSQECPVDWIERMREQSILEMEYDFHINGIADKAFTDNSIEFTLENFSDLYETVQRHILKDEKLTEFFELKKEIFQEAHNLIVETESLIRKER